MLGYQKSAPGPPAIPSLSASLNRGSLTVFNPVRAHMSLKGEGAGDDFRYPGMRNPPLPLSMTASLQGSTYKPLANQSSCDVKDTKQTPCS